MTVFYDIDLNGHRFDGDDERLRRTRLEPASERSDTYDQRYDFTTLVYDAFFDEEDGQVVIVCPSFRNFRKLMLEEATFEIDGAPTFIAFAKEHSRGDVLRFGKGLAGAATLTIRHPLFTAEIAVGSQMFDVFSDQRTLLTISKDNKLTWISDWLKYYVEEHGAEAVLLFDNQSTAYSMEALRDAMTSVDGLKTAGLVRAWYPFGPGGQGTVNHDSKYLHMMLFEMARLRFLGDAKCVLNVDIDEIVYARGGRTIFDATIADPRGYLRLEGKWAYPARNDGESAPVHADHRLVAKERDPVNRKWCVLPRSPAGTRIWKTHRIFSRRDPTSPEFGFWHCRSISNNWDYDRTGWNADDLVEERRLCDAMHRVFGHPASPPTIRRADGESPRVLVGLTRRDGPYLLEWIAHHRTLGFEDIRIYSADDRGASLDLLNRLDETGVIRLHHHSRKKRRWLEPLAAQFAEDLDHTASSWALCLSIREFLNIKTGTGFVSDLIGGGYDADMIRLPVKTFSMGGQCEFIDAAVLPRMTTALSTGDQDYRTLFGVRRGIETVTLRGPEPFYGVRDDFDAIDALGAPVLDEDASLDGTLAEVNHYKFRSLDAWLFDEMAYREPGEAEAIVDQTLAALNGPAVFDDSIQRLQSERSDALAELRRDDMVRRLHRAAVTAHSVEINEALGNAEIAAARARMMAALHMQDGDEARRDIVRGIATLRTAIEGYADTMRAAKATEKLDRIEKILKL